MFCKHQWKILSEKTTKSRFELAIEAIRGNTRETDLPHQFCDTSRKFIQIVTCLKCGKLKRFVEEI